jgi:formamidopyrimidine-DNA glycosylase
MIEIPESNTLEKQLNETIKGKKIVGVVTNNFPHKFAFFYENPEEYGDILKGKTVTNVKAFGGQIEIILMENSSNNENSSNEKEDKTIIALAEDTQIRYIEKEKSLPEKHQLLIRFDDSSSLVCSARLYAQLHVSSASDYENEYFDVAKEKPSPLSDDFDMKYFESLLYEVRATSSLKAFLATKQRIPGLGNGTLQDILFNGKLHPKTKVKKLSEEDKERLYESVKNTLSEMVKNNGRNTEKTLFGEFGDYEVILSAKTFKNPCSVCGAKLVKESYLGGTIYFCPVCQKLDS